MVLKHTFVSPIPDNNVPDEFGPDEWNAEHLLAGPAPITDSSPGTTGQMAFDGSGNFYIAYAPNSWARFSGTLAFGGTSSHLLLRDGSSMLLLRDGTSALLLGH